jgi:HK97 family phage major capsid protein
MNRNILHARRDELESQLRRIHAEAGDRPLSRDQQSRWDSLDAELREVRSDIEALADADALAGRVASQRAKYGALKVDGTDPGRSGLRDSAQRILDDQRRASGHLSARQGDHVDALLRSTDKNVDGDVIATMILLTENDTYRSAFQRVMTDPHPVLTAAEAEALRAYESFRAMSLTDGAGGFGVPAFLDASITLVDQGATNPFLDLARVVTITSDVWKGVASTGVTWSWDGEATAVSDDTPTLTQPTITPRHARGFVPFSFEIGMDYPGFATEVAGLLSEGYAELTAQAFATGNGTTEPQGVITALDALTTSEVVVTTDGTFSAADISKVWTALPDRARGNATWVMSHDVLDAIAAWGDAYGGRTSDLAGQPASLRQRPIRTSSYFPAFTGTTGAANLLVVGDFRKGMTIVQRAGMTVELVPHLFDVTSNMPTSQRGWLAYARVGSGVIDPGALRLLQNT